MLKWMFSILYMFIILLQFWDYYIFIYGHFFPNFFNFTLLRLNFFNRRLVIFAAGVFKLEVFVWTCIFLEISDFHLISVLLNLLHENIIPFFSFIAMLVQKDLLDSLAQWKYWAECSDLNFWVGFHMDNHVPDQIESIVELFITAEALLGRLQEVYALVWLQTSCSLEFHVAVFTFNGLFERVPRNVIFQWALRRQYFITLVTSVAFPAEMSLHVCGQIKLVQKRFVT